MEIKKSLKKFWKFLNEDSWKSTIVFVLLFLLVVMYLVSPLLGILTGFSYSESVIKIAPSTTFPFVRVTSSPMNLVIVESCSMHHSMDLENIIENNIYAENNISLEDTKDWGFKKGFTKGDIIFSIAPRNIEIGDVIIFESNQEEVKYPIIHRIIRKNETIATKGDNNFGLLPYEKEIQLEQIKAKSVFRIPYVGWIKLILFDWQKPEKQRGLC
jgi:hypothetical protein